MMTSKPVKQRICAKIDKFRIRLIAWIVMQLISRSQNIEFGVEQSWKKKHGKLFSVHYKTWKTFSVYSYSFSYNFF